MSILTRSDSLNRVLLLAFVLFLPATKVCAMTAGEFLDQLNDQQRATYIDGALEMLAYDFASAGNASSAACATDWYYKGQGPRQLAAILTQHRDLPVAGILKTLATRSCPR